MAGTHSYDMIRRLDQRRVAWDVGGGGEAKWREFCEAVGAAATVSGTRISAWYTEAARLRGGDGQA